MWKPAERLRYEPLDLPWPTEEAAADSALFSPLAVGRVALENRVWVPAMVPWRAEDSGYVTDDVLDWYARFAEGRPGAIVVEATGIRDIASGPLLRISHDRYLDGLQKIVERVREASGGHTRLFIQVIDFLSIRRRPRRERFLREFLALTPEHRERIGAPGDESEESCRERLVALSDGELEGVLAPREFEALTRGARERVDDMHLPHIEELPEVLPGRFADAAARAQAVGFDGVELHYAHAYTMASFLSRRNRRPDGYGGSLENRLRLPLEVFRAVRERVGDFTVGCRFLAEECIDGGNEIDDALAIAEAFAGAGMDFLSLSRGGKFDDAKQPKVGEAAYPYTGRSGYECMPAYLSDQQGPFGRNTDAASAIRQRLREAGLHTPVVLAGGMHHYQQAEALLREDAADAIGLARQALADPDWPIKVRSGKGDEVRLCVYSNYCEGLDQKHKQVTCNLWDREARDASGAPLSRDGKRRLVAPPWPERDLIISD